MSHSQCFWPSTLSTKPKPSTQAGFCFYVLHLYLHFTRRCAFQRIILTQPCKFEQFPFLTWIGFTDSYIYSDLLILILHTLAQASLLALKNALQYLYFNFHLDIPKNPKYMCTQNHNPSRVHRYTNHTQGESKCYSRRGNSPMSHRIHPSQMYIHRYQDSWMR